MKKIFTLIPVFLFAAGTLFAQGTPRARIETMFASFKPGEMDLALDVFSKKSFIPSEMIDSLKSQVRTVISGDRKILGFEFVQEQNVGESVKRLTYILKLNDQPLFWSFSFYKPVDIWVPLKINLVQEF
jgi:hypothetical protein